MPKYRVVDGKHRMPGGIRGESIEYIRRGDTIDLSEEEAKKFPGKFAPVKVHVLSEAAEATEVAEAAPAIEAATPAASATEAEPDSGTSDADASASTETLPTTAAAPATAPAVPKPVPRTTTARTGPPMRKTGTIT